MDIGELLWALINYNQPKPSKNKDITEAEQLLLQMAKTTDNFALGGLGQAGIKENDEFLKQLALNAGLSAVGGAVAKGGAKGAQKGIDSGLLQRALLKLTKQRIGTHSSPVTNLKNILPNVAPANPQMGSLVYMMNPDRIGPAGIRKVHEMYGDGGSLYLAKVPKKNLKISSSQQLRSTKPVKVVNELNWPYIDGYMPKADRAKRDAQIAAALKKAGVKVKKPKSYNK
jgi:hypothetical protein